MATTEFGLDFINQIVNPEQLKQLAQANAERYQTASPFPHIVFDDFFPTEFLAKVSEEFPEANAKTWQKFDAKAEKKLASQGDADMGPYVRALISVMNSGMFIEFLEELTGISGLLPDPHLTGGGMHQIMPGGKLALHVDFNKYQRKNLERRLNILVYLNENWEESYGGYLELWDQEVTEAKVKILPIFNRVALFSTTEISWHGHPDPLTCPDNRSRRSVALYYYTVERPEHEMAAEHTTIFKERPGENLAESWLTRDNLKQLVKDCIPPILIRGLKKFK
jgi:Rps23 Pro-64 3,4-dihydroxylase Tpa1-like proline 4-hydroxylase